MFTDYELIRSKRKTLSIRIFPEGRVAVYAPEKMRRGDIQAFVDQKTPWIEKHLAQLAQRKAQALPPMTEQEIKEISQAAARDIPQRVEHYAGLMRVSFGRITIRCQKTRWGSCSAKGNLNFNCLLMLFPEAIRDYVVVHELCHRIELNHSARFWAAVERVMPDYAARRKALKEQGQAIMDRIR